MENMGKKSIGIIEGIICGSAIVGTYIGKRAKEQLQKEREKADKHLELYLVLYQWIKLQQEGKNIARYFQKNGYNTVAIYGMSYMGELVYRELRNSDIKVSYGIDKNRTGTFDEIDIYTMDSALGKVDVIVVTAVTYYDEIKRELKSKVKCPIISLDDVIYSLVED